MAILRMPRCRSAGIKYLAKCIPKMTGGDILVSILQPQEPNFTKIKDIKDNKGMVVGAIYKYL